VGLDLILLGPNSLGLVVLALDTEVKIAGPSLEAAGLASPFGRLGQPELTSK
jgi:hypothetical protein